MALSALEQEPTHPKWSLRIGIATSVVTSVALATLAAASLVSPTPLFSSTVAYTLLGVSGALVIAAALFGYLLARKNRETPPIECLPQVQLSPQTASPLQELDGIKKALAPVAVESPYVDNDTPFGKNRTLPNELVMEVFKWLGPEQLVRCFQVCRKWRDLLKDDSFWKRRAQHMGMRENTHSTWKASCVSRFLNRRIGRGEPVHTPYDFSVDSFQEFRLAPSGDTLFVFSLEHGNGLIQTLLSPTIPKIERVNLRTEERRVTRFPAIAGSFCPTQYGVIDDQRVVMGDPARILMVNLKKERAEIFLKAPESYLFSTVGMMNPRLLVCDLEPEQDASETEESKTQVWDIETGALLYSKHLNSSCSIVFKLPENQFFTFRMYNRSMAVTVVDPLEGNITFFPPSTGAIHRIDALWISREHLSQLCCIAGNPPQQLRREINLSTGEIRNQNILRLYPWERVTVCVSGERVLCSTYSSREMRGTRIVDMKTNRVIYRNANPPHNRLVDTQMEGATMVGKNYSRRRVDGFFEQSYIIRLHVFRF